MPRREDAAYRVSLLPFCGRTLPICGIFCSEEYKEGSQRRWEASESLTFPSNCRAGTQVQMGLMWNVLWKEAWAGKFPLSIKEWWALSRSVGARKEGNSFFPWAPSEHPWAECHTLPAMQQESSSLGHQAMKYLWLGKYKQNRATFLTWLDLGVWVGKTRNGWMGWLEKQCQLQICHPHLTSSLSVLWCPAACEEPLE